MITSEDRLRPAGLQDPHLPTPDDGIKPAAVGVGLALGVLMDTFIVRTVLVPCTVILLGRWNWWPSALSRARAQPGGPDGPGPDGPDGPGSPGGEGTEQDTESAAPRTR